MANIIPVSNMIAPLPDFNATWRQGVEWGQQQKLRSEARDRERQVRNLAPQIVAGDPAAVAQAAAIDPKTTESFQDAGDSQLRRFKGFVGLIDRARQQAQATGDWRHVNASLQVASPYLSQLLGKPGPTEWPQGDPQWEAGWEGLKARLAGVEGLGNGQPTGFREFDMKARAAGLQPGTKEYEQAAKVALGVEGRAASGGFSSDTIEWAGRKYPARFNPRNGSQEIWDGSKWVMLGGAATGQAPADTYETAEDGSAIPMQTVRGPDGSIYRVQAGDPRAAQTGAADMAVGGNATNVQLPERAVAKFSNSTPPGIGVSRTPEEDAGAVERAKQQAQLEVLPQELGMRTQAAIDQAGGAEAAKIAAERRAERLATLPQTVATADQTIGLLGELIDHPGRVAATGTSSLNPLNRVPGTDAYNFNVLLDQIKGQAFLQAFQSLKGGGAITEREGQAATNAIARLNAAQSEGEFVKALRDLRKVVEDGRTRAIESASGGVAPVQSQAQQQPAAGRVLRYNPATGDFE